MRLKSIAIAVLALMLPATGWADPAGTFDLRGVNPDEDQQYTGTVTVTRTGQTYHVVWEIGGQGIVGTGVGLKLVDGRIVMGGASEDDVGISIAYGSGASFGTVVYFEQPDGTWHGIWAYDGWDHISTEDWFPRKRKVVSKTDAKAEKQIKSLKTQEDLSPPMPAQAGPKF
jgi:hypothetical protein